MLLHTAKAYLAFVAVLLSACLGTAAADLSWRPPIYNSLSNGYVTSFAEDAEGYMWIGTKRGLNKYNGSTYRIFSQSTGGLSSDKILSLLPNPEGGIWIGSDTGIEFLKDEEVGRRPDKTEGPVFQMRDLDRERILFSVNDGLKTLDRRTEAITTVYSDNAYNVSGRTLQENRFEICGDGSVWFYGTDSFLPISVIGPDFRLVKKITPPAQASVTGIAELEGHVFVGTTRGLLCYAMETGEPLQMPAHVREYTENSPILFVEKDRGLGRIVVGIRDKGMYSISPQLVDMFRIWPDETLSDVGKAICYTSPSSTWLSKDHKGFEMKSRQRELYTTSLEGLKDDEQIQKIWNSQVGLVFAVTTRRIFNVNTSEGGYHDVTPEDLRGDGDIGTSLYDGADSLLWLIAGGTSLRAYRFDHYQGLSLRFSFPVEPSPCIWKDDDGTVCVLQGKSVLKVDRSGTSQSLPCAVPEGVYDCVRTSDGSVFLLAQDGVYRKTGHSSFDKIPVEADFPTCICTASDGRIVIGTRNDGILIYSPGNKSFETVTSADGLPDNAIRSVAQGDKGLWIATRNSIVHMTSQYRNFISFDYAVPEMSEFVPGCVLTKPNGDIVFASQGFFVERKSDAHLGNVRIPLAMDAILVNGERYRQKDKNVFRHDENQFVFYFSGLSFNIGRRLNFEYRLVGYDKAWINAFSETRVAYSRIPSGRYDFQVRVLNPSGEWQEDVLEFPFRVKPSPWASLPAVILYIIFAAALAGVSLRIFMNMRRTREHAEEAEQQRLVSEQLDRERSEFFTNVSHEYRTPLSLIYGPVRELEQDPSMTEGQKRLVSMISRNAERMKSLTDRILNFNRFGKESDRLSVMNTDIVPLVKSLVRLFGIEVEEKGIDMGVDAPEHLGVWCDWEKLDVIIINLVSNAVKYTPKGGSVKMSVRTGGDGMLVLSIADTGTGISDAKKADIFKRYERLLQKVDGATPEGYGIGLNYVLYLVNLHKGSIDVADNTPSGSVFTVKIPTEREAYDDTEVLAGQGGDEDSAAGSPIAYMHDDGKDFKSVMVVDDDGDVRGYLLSLFRDSYNVILAVNAKDAMEKLETGLPDLVISDVMMPGQSGMDLCRSIKDNPDYCHIPVILLTAMADMENTLEGVRAWADAYVSKPFDPQYLKAVVGNMFLSMQRIQAALGRVVMRPDTPDTEEVPDEAVSSKISQRDKELLERLRAVMAEHVADADFGVEEMAKEVYMSRTSLYSKVRGLLGMSIQEMMSDFRLEAAKGLLETSDMTVSEVADAVGFTSLNGFSRAFKKKYGLPPSQAAGREPKQ